MTRRIEKINELLRREVSEVLQREMKDPKIGFVTVTRVETSKDLQYSTIFTSIMGDEKERLTAMEHLNHAAGYVQRQLSGKVRLKNMPKIKFKLDTSIDHSIRIDEILRKIADEGHSNDEGPGEDLEESGEETRQ